MNWTINKTVKILIVEDHLPDALYLEEMLSGDTGGPFLLNSTDRLSSAFMLLEQEHYDLVLLDLNLPDSQGMDTAYSLRRNFSTIPIIILTALVDEEFARDSLKKIR